MSLDSTYRICWSLEDWAAALREAQESPDFALDFETKPKPGYENVTSALRAEDGSKIAGMGIAWLDRDGTTIRSAYIPIRHDTRFAGGVQPTASGATALLDEFIRARESNKTIVIANISMELSFMLGENIAWPLDGQLHDVQIAARVLNKGVGWKELIGLKELQAHELKRNMASLSELDRWLTSHGFKPGRDIWRAPAPIVAWYCQDDARDTLAIFLKWKRLIHRDSPTEWWWYRAANSTDRFDLYELEMRAAVEAVQSFMRGTRVDLSLCRRRASAAEVLQGVATRWIRAKMNVPTLNPGSQTQLRGLLFGPYGFKLSVAHLTDSFKELSDKDQALTMAGQGEKPLVEYASLDVDALDYYAEAYPEHADLMFMLAVYRKCNTAAAWFNERVLEFGHLPIQDPWWGENGELLYLIFHRLRTVGTLSGRMSSSDYNAQQVPKRFKMLLDFESLIRILTPFLSAEELQVVKDVVDVAHAKKGDEAKSLGIDPGAPVIDMSVRAMFIARPDMNLRGWDLSQVEMRGFAHFSGNKLLCGGYGKAKSDAEITAELGLIRDLMSGKVEKLPITRARFQHLYIDDEGFDIHAFIAKQLNISRKEAKGINFGIVYGMGKKKLARNMGWSLDKGRHYLDEYYRNLPEIEELQKRIRAVLRDRGYIFDPFGRRYFLSPDRAYVGLNRLIQGWAAGTFKLGFVRTCGLFASQPFGGGSVNYVTRRPTYVGARVLKCVHDEQIGEVKRSLDTYQTDYAVRACMTLVHGLKTPLGTSSEVSPKSWDEARAVPPPEYYDDELVA